MRAVSMLGVGLIFHAGVSLGQPLRLPVAPPKPPLNIDRMIDVIVSLEGGRWENPGGAMCWTQRSWAEETSLPFRLASHKYVAYKVAAERISRQIVICERFKVPATPRLLIGSWKRGLSGAMKDEKIGRPSDYAVRGLNLFLDPTFK